MTHEADGEKLRRTFDEEETADLGLDEPAGPK